MPAETSELTVGIGLDHFNYIFLILMPFISLSCLTALAKTSTTMLNRSGESVHHCLFLIVEEKCSVLFFKTNIR